MLTWIVENIGTIAACIGLAALVAGAVIVLIRDKRKGRCSCGGNCAHCPMGGACHKR